jgi:hypothetical protein
MDLSPNVAVVLVALIAIIVPVLNWWQNRGIALKVDGVTSKVAGVTDKANAAEKQMADNHAVQQEQLRQLHQIHVLVNSRLSDALQTIEALKALLLLVISAEVAADDPRVKAAIAKNS